LDGVEDLKSLAWRQNRLHQAAGSADYRKATVMGPVVGVVRPVRAVANLEITVPVYVELSSACENFRGAFGNMFWPVRWA
jgi:hypothetical protein